MEENKSLKLRNKELSEQNKKLALENLNLNKSNNTSIIKHFKIK